MELWYKGGKNTGVSQWVVVYNQAWGVWRGGGIGSQTASQDGDTQPQA